MIKAACGETMIHSTETIWEILAREKWLGCRYDESPMFDILGSTPVWAPYMIFFGFYDIKIYMYYVLKSICIIKGTLVVSDFILARQRSEKVFDRPWVLKKRKSTDTLLFNYELILCIDVYICYDTVDLFKTISTPSSLKLVGFSLPFLHWARGLLTLSFPSFQVRC